MKFTDLDIEAQEMTAEMYGMTLDDYKALLETRATETIEEFYSRTSKEKPDDMTDEMLAESIKKFTAPFTSHVVNDDGSITVYRAPVDGNDENEWDIYTIEEKTDAQRFEELFGD